MVVVEHGGVVEGCGFRGLARVFDHEFVYAFGVFVDGAWDGGQLVLGIQGGEVCAPMMAEFSFCVIRF